MSFEAQGEEKSYFLAGKWNQPNTTMRDLGSTNDVVAVIPQDEILNVDIKFYFSNISSKREDALEDPKYASNKFNTLIVISFFATRLPFVIIP